MMTSVHMLWLLIFRLQNDGEVMLLFGLLYAPGRFILEIWRADTPLIWGTGLNAGQWMSVALFIGCTTLFIFPRIRRYILSRNPYGKHSHNVIP